MPSAPPRWRLAQAPLRLGSDNSECQHEAGAECQWAVWYSASVAASRHPPIVPPSMSGVIRVEDARKRQSEKMMLELERPGDLAQYVGKEIGVSDRFTVDRRSSTPADATGDHQWIHVDVERAKRDAG